MPGCSSNQQTETVSTGNYNENQNMDTTQDINQIEYGIEEENSYVGIWVAKPKNILFRIITIYYENSV